MMGRVIRKRYGPILPNHKRLTIHSHARQSIDGRLYRSIRIDIEEMAAIDAVRCDRYDYRILVNNGQVLLHCIRLDGNGANEEKS
jgi:hypothetical protein